MSSLDSTKNSEKNYNSYLEGNTVKFANLTNQKLIPEFIRSMNRLVYIFRHKQINIDCGEVTKVYPLPAVPIVGCINYFKEKEGIKIKYRNLSSYLKYIDFVNPKQISDANIGKSTSTLDKIWKFSNSDEIHQLVTSYVTSIRRNVICKEGVLSGVIWSMNEVMDNVIQHASIDNGFIMAQMDKKNNHLNVCIYDYGRGIFMTLRDSEHKPRTAVDAITLAIKEGVTRDKSIGQGNGLWGLYNIVSQNNGKLSIISGKGGILVSDSGNISRACNEMVVLNKYNQSTTISFHLNLDKEISIKDALSGYDVIDMSIEDMKSDFGDVIYKIADIGSGTGTRESGIKIKNELINIYQVEKKRIVIDFEGVGIVSSSFADELISKLIDEMGFYQYQSIFHLVNMNSNVQTIFESSLKKRLSKG
jgi:hypothetical protein